MAASYGVAEKRCSSVQPEEVLLRCGACGRGSKPWALPDCCGEQRWHEFGIFRFRAKRLTLRKTSRNHENRIGRIRMQQRQAVADTRRRAAGVRLHRAQQ